MRAAVTIAVVLLISITGNGAQLFEQFVQKDGLLSNQVYGVVQDGQGRLWVATLQGVCSFNGLSFTCYGVDKPSDQQIVGISVDRQQRVWCYSSDGSLYQFVDGGFRPFPYNHKLKSEIRYTIINNLVFDRLGDIWITTVLGSDLLKLNTKTGGLQRIDTDGIKAKYYVKEVQPGIFITGNAKGSSMNRVYVQGIDTGYFFNLSGGAGITKSKFLSLDGGGFLYAKDFELVRVNDGVQARIFLEKSIECLLQDADGRIWVGLNTGGLVSFPGSDIQNRGRTHYLSNKTVTDLYEDVSGSIWIATSNSGLYQYSSAPSIHYNSPKVFSSDSDSGEVETKEPVEISYEPSEIGREESRLGTGQIPPTVFISGVKIKDQDTSVLSSYELTHDKNFIKINFAGVSPSHPELLQFRYKMSGVDNNWTYTASTEVQYTTLPPGEYEFTVNAMNKEGVWGENPAQIKFNILHPVWQRWWFILAMGVFALSAVVLVIYFWQKSIRKKEREKAFVNKRIADLELQALRAQMNPHFLFNTISSIQYFITANDTDSALRYLSKFARLMRTIMENSKKPRIPLKDELSALQLYLELEALRFKGKFDFDIRVDKSLDTVFDEIPPMLIQPYIENALNHGIMNKDGKGNIRVELTRKNNHILCSVEDDGIGRKKAQEIKDQKKINHKSRGMSITQNRLQIINRMDNSDLSVDIEDLHDKDNKPTGTRVSIYIPIKLQHNEN